jgi:acyl-CoA synthetase (NDP forming)
LLAAFGVPVVPEALVSQPSEVMAAAEAFGYPVVLKAVGRDIGHKTEKGLVRLNLNEPEALAQAAGDIRSRAGGSLAGILVQPQVAGDREWVAGLLRDAHFGPVVMFGLGGVYTEALSDVTFALAPLDRRKARQMLTDIRAAALLGPIRGQAAVDTDALVSVLMKLSDLAMAHPEVAEVDINPLITRPDGSILAVDALVVTAPPQTVGKRPAPVPPNTIGELFYPRSIAIVGASGQMGKWGHMLAVNTISGGYRGQIYLVNPRGGTIVGRPVFGDVEQIPDRVDLAVVTVPAAKVMALLPGFARKGIRSMVLVTSGFGETGHSGRRLERQLVDACRRHQIVMLGPNTMGICNPHIRLYCTGSPVRPRPGSTAMVAQSGNMGTQLLAFAEEQGIGIRGFCGSGNEAMISIEDYLDGFERDELSRTVVLYIESVKDPRRFFESAERVGRKKPVVLLKGGQTEAGNRAAASHTGAMGSDARIFAAACRQHGIVKVERPMELLDLSAAFSSLPLPSGNRVAIMTLGGGWGVITADLCTAHGLAVPELPPDMVARLDALLPDYWSRANPIDLVGENDPMLPQRVLEELMRWDGCDAVINLGLVGRRIFVQRLCANVARADSTHSDGDVGGMNRLVAEGESRYIEQVVAQTHRYRKPVIGVSLLTDAESRTVYPSPGGEYKAVFYPTPERAVNALEKMHAYQCFLTSGGGSQSGGAGSG